MKDLIFSCEFPDSNYVFDFEQSLFNQEKFRLLQKTEGWQSYYALKKKSKKIVAAVHFHITDDKAFSPLRAPFGSLDFSRSLPLPGLYEFIGFCETDLKQKGVERIVITNPPELYHPYGSILTTFFLNNHYSISAAEVDTLIPVRHGKIHRKLHRSERRRLSKSEKIELEVRQLNPNDLEKVYNFILGCRKAKGFELSMTLDQLKKTADHFPERYLLFAVFKGRQMAAASVSIIVKKDVMYQFYHDHDESFDHLSPVVKLIAGIHEFCFQKGIDKLDLGTSAADTRPNFGLLNFKLLLGGTPNSKFTFEKSLADA